MHLLSWRRTAPLMLAALLSLLSALSPSEASAEALAPTEAFSTITWDDGEYLYVGWDVSPGYYMYRDKFDVTGDGVEGPLELPGGEVIDDPFFGETETYSERFVSRVALDSDAGNSGASIEFQGCASEEGICYPATTIEVQSDSSIAPERFKELVGEIEKKSPESPLSGGYMKLLAGSGLLVIAGIFFLQGLALTFTPCVFPMIPIVSSIVVGQTANKRRAFALSGCYVAGMVATYTALGLVLGLVGSGLNIQAYMQSAPVLITFSGIFVLLALVMMGKLPLASSPAIANTVSVWQEKAQKAGSVGAVVAGALSVVVVSPCVSAPLAGTLMFVSATGNALTGGLALFAMALGMGVPLVLVGTFGASMLPRSGGWMNRVKNVFGFMLLGVSVWLLSRLLPSSIEIALWASLVFALGASFAGFRFSMPKPSTPAQWAGVVPMALGAVLFVGAMTGGQSITAPFSGILQQAQTEDDSDAFRTVTSQSQLKVALADAASSGKKPVIFFTADWCPSCAAMHSHYSDPAVEESMEGFARIDVDVTKSTPETRSLMDDYGIFGPPGILFIENSEKQDELNIYGEIGASELASRFENARRSLGI